MTLGHCFGVMAGLVLACPGHPVCLLNSRKQGVGARDKRGHDGGADNSITSIPLLDVTEVRRRFARPDRMNDQLWEA